MDVGGALHRGFQESCKHGALLIMRWWWQVTPVLVGHTQTALQQPGQGQPHACLPFHPPVLFV